MLNIEEFADKNQLFDGHYALIRPLSVDGATADVWLALDANTVSENVNIYEAIRLPEDEIAKLGLIVAIKIYRPQNALDIEGEQRFRDEYMIVYNCHHTNLIHPTHFSIFQETPYLVLPYCKLGSSELLIGNLTDNDKIWKYIQDVSSGLAYLHALTPPIIHQDIKPANVLLDDTLHYAITDFGISSQKGGAHVYYYDEDNSGTLAYMAPERFQEDAEPIPQSDIWALGATLYELLTGKVPFGEEGGKAQLKENHPIPPIPNVSAEIQQLIHDCLAKEPGDRPSAEQIMKAAQAKQYPLKSKKLLFGAIAGVVLLVMIILSYFTIKSYQNTHTYQPSLSERYEIALDKMNANDAEQLHDGIILMDSLCNDNYIPALYQMAFTYGWYSDSISVRRKRLLGIEVNHFIPVADQYTHTTLGLFTKILEQNDSAYASINANAAYRMAVYYIMENHVQVQDTAKGKQFLYIAKGWAEFADDDPDLMRRIDDSLNSFKIKRK